MKTKKQNILLFFPVFALLNFSGKSEQYHICMPSMKKQCVHYWLMYISCCKWLSRRGPRWLKFILLTRDMTLHKVIAQEARIKSISFKNSIYFMTEMKSKTIMTNWES